MKCMIVAYSKNRVIGSKGGIPWQGKMPADMRHFKELSMGKTVIMGRKTYESIGRPLPNRQNIVISRDNFSAPGVTTVHSLEAAYAAAEADDVAIIGGGQIYAAALNDAHIIYATEIDAYVDGDVLFPELGGNWKERSRETFSADEKNAYAYSFVTYARISAEDAR